MEFQVEHKHRKKCALMYHEICFSSVSELETKQKVTCNVYSYFWEQSNQGGITISPLSHAVKGTGLSQTTIVQIICEKGQLRRDKEFTTPSNHYHNT